MPDLETVEQKTERLVDATLHLARAFKPLWGGLSSTTEGAASPRVAGSRSS